ncbi:hypothetical protein B0H12DRAFT_137162 [Mycena haematopus]|nr:hypothetical protein B0H12DRAFT_137162 [Mycena haematopus]
MHCAYIAVIMEDRNQADPCDRIHTPGSSWCKSSVAYLQDGHCDELLAPSSWTKSSRRWSAASPAVTALTIFSDLPVGAQPECPSKMSPAPLCYFVGLVLRHKACVCFVRGRGRTRRLARELVLKSDFEEARFNNTREDAALGYVFWDEAFLENWTRPALEGLMALINSRRGAEASKSS